MFSHASKSKVHMAATDTSTSSASGSISTRTLCNSAVSNNMNALDALDALLEERLEKRNVRQSGCFDELALLFACQRDALEAAGGVVGAGGAGSRSDGSTNNSEAVSDITTPTTAAASKSSLPSFPKSVFELQRVVLDLRNQADALRASYKEQGDSLRRDQGTLRRTEAARAELSSSVTLLTEELKQLRMQNSKTEEKYLEVMARNHDLETRIVEEKLKMADILNEMNASMGNNLSNIGTVEESSSAEATSPPSTISKEDDAGMSPAASNIRWASNLGVNIPGSWKVMTDTRGAQVSSIAYSSDGAVLVSGSSDGVVQLWSTAFSNKLEGANSATLKSPVLSVDMRGSLVLATSERACYMWRTDSSGANQGNRFEALHTLTGHVSTVVAGKLAPDCRHVASGARKVKVWDVTSGNCTRTVDAFSKCLSLDFSPEGTLLVTGHADKAVRLWDMRSAKQVNVFQNLHRAPIIHVCFCADGDKVLSTSMDHTLSLFDPRYLASTTTSAASSLSIFDSGGGGCSSGGSGGNSALLETLTYLSHPEFRANPWWCKAAASPGRDSNGRLLVACGSKDGSLHVWAADSINPEFRSSVGESLFQQNAHSAAITCTAWSPRGNELATSDAEGAILIWSCTGS